MTYFDDAKLLADRAIAQIPTINQEYDLFVSSKVISATFKVLSKEILGNLQSSLDYCACGVYQTINGDLGKAKPMFPVANINDDLDGFSQKLKSALPKIYEMLPQVADYIIGCQHLRYEDNHWLTHLKNITNTNKHTKLTAREGFSGVDLSIQSAGQSFTITAARINMGSKAKINIGDVKVQGPQEIKPGHSIDFDGGGKVFTQENKTIFFESTGIAVVPFIEAVAPAVGKTVHDISAMCRSYHL